MSAATTPEERADLLARIRRDTQKGCLYVTANIGIVRRLLDERDDLVAEVERLRSKGEIISARYAISHAPKGVKGGPWESLDGPDGTTTTDLRRAISWSSRLDAARWIVDIGKLPPHAHAVRLITRRKKART